VNWNNVVITCLKWFIRVWCVCSEGALSWRARLASGNNRSVVGRIGVGIGRLLRIDFEGPVRSTCEEAGNGLEGPFNGRGCFTDAKSHNGFRPGYPKFDPSGMVCG
jgi:hypothetical protein